jgi:hypothetical protein
MTPFLRDNTPLEDHLATLGLLVKREDLSCPPPGPPFSKTRGVLAHVRARYDEGVRLFGVLDTAHSQAGHAVAAAVRWVNENAEAEDRGKPIHEVRSRATVTNFFPVRKGELSPFREWRLEDCIVIPPFGNGQTALVRPPQLRSIENGATLYPLLAGRSAILYHQARKITEAAGGYLMPNALRLGESVEETAEEVVRTIRSPTDVKAAMRAVNMPWIVSVSSGTIAAGVIRGLERCCETVPPIILHLGYDRSETTLLDYVTEKSGVRLSYGKDILFINEGYAYADVARGPALDLPFPANPHYDRKLVAWWIREGRERYGQAVFWLIG